MAQIRSGRRGFWIAQLFVAVILGLIAFRFLGALGRENELMGARAGTRTPASSSSLSTPRPGRPGSPSGRAASRPEGNPAPAWAPSTPAPDRTTVKNTPYAPGEYRTGLVLDEKSYKIWNLDPRELSWLLANKRQILISDLDTRPDPEGGLRILSIREGSFGACRGLRVGDLLHDINGQTLEGPSDLDDLIEDPAHSGARGWRILLEREGKPLTLDYRPAPGGATTIRNH
jgi:hypothetical protein